MFANCTTRLNMHLLSAIVMGLMFSIYRKMLVRHDGGLDQQIVCKLDPECVKGREEMIDVLRRADGNQSKAAKMLGGESGDHLEAYEKIWNRYQKRPLLIDC